MPRRSRSRLAQLRHLHAVLDPLVHSVRGQIFLANFLDALPLLGAPELVNALMSIRSRDAKKMHEANYLAHVKATLHKPIFGQLLRNAVTSFSEFAPDTWVVNILPYPSFKAYYEDPKASMSGHVPFGTTVGTKTNLFRADASTAPFWWIAPRYRFYPKEVPESRAQESRDMLGLVHYEATMPLVAMHISPGPGDFFRPTVVEANPNARFRQVDPFNPSEKRWGRTVDLEKLHTLPKGHDIGGLPELVAKQVRLAGAREVVFYFLGSPVLDRSTTSMDMKFLDEVLAGRAADTFPRAIIDLLAR